MTIFVDASAIVAIITAEPEKSELERRLNADADRLISGVAQWEAALAIRKAASTTTSAALTEVRRYCDRLGFRLVPIDDRETLAAADASTRYGKGSGHPARLNLGDCFAYACAKTNAARLLYKGNDFSHTDLG